MAGPSQPSSGTKAFAVLILLVGLGALGYGGYSLSQTITSPFKISIPTKDLSEILPQNEDREIEELKLKDTDHDLLSDYDEINIFNTSPYLADSDSDTIADNLEIQGGTDPNCPTGQDCRTIRLVTPDTKISDIFPQFSGSQITLKDKTLQEFKKILIDQGYSEEKLAQVSDDALLIFLEESLKAQEAEVTGQEPQNLNLDEVRQFFIDMGVPQDEVYNMSNAELEDLLNKLQ